MKENKDIHPIDKLFKQSLEGHSQSPPPSVWKGILKKQTGQSLSAGKWFIGSGGMSVISAIILLSVSWVLYKSFNSESSSPKQENKISTTLPVSRQTDENISISKGKNTLSDSKVVGSTMIPAEKLTPTPKRNIEPMNPPKAVRDNSEGSYGPNNSGQIDKVAAIKTLKPVNKQTQPSTVSSMPTNNEDLTANKPKTDVPITTSNSYVSGEKNPSSTNQVSQNQVTTKQLVPTNPSSSQDVLNSAKNINHQNNPSKIDSSDSKSAGPKNVITPKGTSTPSWLQVMPKELVWQIALNGNMGYILQKDRNANPFYGSMITGGLWSTKSKIGFETGVGINRYKDYGQVNNNRIISDTLFTNDTIIHFQDSVPIITIRVDTLINNTTYLDTIKYQYSYTYFQIPLLFSKQITNFGKLFLDVKAGPILGFMISKTESITKTNRSDYGEVYPGINKNYTRLNINWQLYVAPQLRWDMSKNLSLTFSPAAVFYLNNIYDKKNRPGSRPFGISVSGGINYKFD